MADMEPQAHSGHGQETQTNQAGSPGGEGAHGPAQPLLPDRHAGPADAGAAGPSPAPVAVPAQPVADPATTPSVPVSPALGSPANPVSPVPVVRVLSPLGIEYVFMTISLFAAAGGLAATLIAVANGKTDFQVLAFPTALLLVSLPIFAWLFLRTKKRELTLPALRQDPSKRRSTQFTQIVCFIVCLFTLVGLVASVFAKLGGQSSMSIVKLVLDCAALLAVFGGILAYYWRDEHVGR